MKAMKDDTGKYPAYAWPGGYPIMYLALDNGTLCPACANGENGSRCAAPDLDPACPDDHQWIVAAMDVYWEGPPLECEHCGCDIDSAYGDPDDHPCDHTIADDGAAADKAYDDHQFEQDKDHG